MTDSQENTPATEHQGEDLLGDGGILKKIIKPGTGEESPQTSDSVIVHYEGKLLDGSVFDASRPRGEPFKFELGVGQVIKGWDVGVASMKKGEIAVFTIQHQYAYGDRGSPPKIPPKATLIFEVELLTWRGKDVSTKQDGSVTKKVLSPGTGDSPKEDLKTTISIVGRYNNVEFDRRDQIQFDVGFDDEIEGLNAAVLSMKKGEKAQFTILPSQAFGSNGNQSKGIPSDATVEYEVTLHDFEKEKATYEMDPREKIQAAEKRKADGNDAFKAGKYIRAAKKYRFGTKYLSFLGNTASEEEKEQSDKLKALLHLNASMAYLKQNDFKSTLSEVDEALKTDPQNIKAIYRKGLALAGLQEFDEAVKLLKSALEKTEDEKSKAEISRELQKLNARIAQSRKKEANLYKRMMESLAT